MFSLLHSFIGVELTLPLAPNSPTNIEGDKTTEESDVEDESAASSWLKSMGLLTHDFPGTNTEITLYPHLNCRAQCVCVGGGGGGGGGGVLLC